MISTVVLSCIVVQTIIALYLFNTLKLKDDFEKMLNAILIILIFHLGTKFFVLVILNSSFLYNNNATGFGLSYGPLLFIAARSYIKRPLSLRVIFLHLLPFSLFTLAYFVNGACYLLKLVPAHFIPFYTSWYQWLAVTSMLVYPIVTGILLYRQQSEKDDKVLLLKQMICVMFTGVILTSVIAVFIFFRTGTIGFDVRLIPYACLAVLPVMILRYRMNQTNVPVQMPKTEIPQVQEVKKEPVQQYKRSAMDAQLMDQYEETLQKFMVKSKIYLQPEISLELLSAKVNIPKHHLTQLLNERFKKNFYVFISGYRINEAIEKLKDPAAEDSILSLAYDCGFNSKSSFNNYFKKQTGLTPSMYRKTHLEKMTAGSQLSS